MKINESLALIMLITVSITAVMTPSTARAMDPLSGRPSVIDGDTLDIHGTRVRLFGIDAPESAQTCLNAQGSAYRCGQMAALALSDFIASRPVTCQPQSVDRYGRQIAACQVAGQDLGAWMVQSGYAIAYRQYSTTYVKHEDYARANRLGVWAGSFQDPALYRKQKQSGSALPAAPAAQPAPPAGAQAVYYSCAQARAAGAAPLRRGYPGYNPKLDGDADGVACE